MNYWYNYDVDENFSSDCKQLTHQYRGTPICA